MNMSVVIEDMGVRLPCKGSSIVIDAAVVAKSQNLKICKDWVSVEPVVRSRPMPVWPLVKPAALKSEAQPTSQPSSELSEVRQSLRKIEQSTKAMLDLLASRSLSPETVIYQPQFKDSQSPTQESQTPPLDPMYIPKTMMPKDAEISMHSKKGEVSIDLNAATEALRNARKR